MLTANHRREDESRVHWPAAVVFDLDGTLVDSVGDITSSINDLLTIKRLAPYDEKVIFKFIGDGMDALVERAFHARGVTFSTLELRSAVEAYEIIYGARLTETTKAYAGVIAVIDELKTRGVGIGICTNKVEDQAVGIVEGLGIGTYFDAIVGARKGRPPKPSPVPLFDTLGCLGIDAAHAIMVGDSIADVKCARAAGVAFVGVSFGYSAIPMRDLAPDATIDTYGEFEAACLLLHSQAP
jgi:phosphoglycolate phosphatase